MGWPMNYLFISWCRISAQIGQVVLFYRYWSFYRSGHIGRPCARILKNLMQNKGFGKSFSKCHSSRGFKRSNLAPCPKSECSTTLKRCRKGKCNANGRPPPPNGYKKTTWDYLFILRAGQIGQIWPNRPIGSFLPVLVFLPVKKPRSYDDQIRSYDDHIRSYDHHICN